MEAGVGEYIRTKTGNITKACKIKDTVVWTDEFMDIHCRYNEGVLEKTDILKHSKNILDLIEVGDIVKTGVDTIFINVMETQENLDYFKELYKNDIDVIRAIITKEQMEEMEYRV